MQYDDSSNQKNTPILLWRIRLEVGGIENSIKLGLKHFFDIKVNARSIIAWNLGYERCQTLGEANNGDVII